MFIVTREEDFNELSDSDKWKYWKDVSMKKWSWHCSSCYTEISSPERARPFHGAEVCCSVCDCILTRRTGGGMDDPFKWILFKRSE